MESKTVFEFLPGDRVRHEGPHGGDLTAVSASEGYYIDDPEDVASLAGAVLVSRPVYPEPGQVAVALSAEDVAAIEHFIEEHGDARKCDNCEHFDRLDSIFGRARLQSK